jgi:biopolymer transport protein ExbD
MADFSAPTQKQGNGKHKQKKLSTRVDLTPMVDLGFLLITFFIFTTSMSEPKALKLNMPDDRPTTKPNQLAKSATLQLLLDKNDQVWYYHADQLAGIQKTSYGNEIRKIIIEKKKFVHRTLGNDDDMALIIKPTKGSTVKNVVDIIDEVIINDVKHYFIVEPSPEELKAIQSGQ